MAAVGWLRWVRAQAMSVVVVVGRCGGAAGAQMLMASRIFLRMRRDQRKRRHERDDVRQWFWSLGLNRWLPSACRFFYNYVSVIHSIETHYGMVCTPAG